jgi:hypothetical protein
MFDLFLLALVGIGLVVVVGLVLLGAMAMAGKTPLRLSGSDSQTAFPPDTPPVEYAYLDSLRAVAYLGQIEGGLATTIQRTDEVSHALNATVAVGTVGKLGVTDETKHSATSTITPQAAERFYTLLRRLREGGEKEERNGLCVEVEDKATDKRDKGERLFWLGEVNEQASLKEVIKGMECIGAGAFVRIRNAQLFLPPFAQTLPRTRSTNVFFGALPSPRTPFTSPEQSVQLARALPEYARLVGTNPRMPFVAAPYGNAKRIGSAGGGLPIFLPSLYRGLTLEPSLLSGPVTIVGKIVYYAAKGTPYIDYPSVVKFGRALMLTRKALRVDLGVCSNTPTVAIRAHSVKQATVKNTKSLRTPQTHSKAATRARSPAARCATRQRTLFEIKKSMTFKPPFAVVLPIAIYE